MSIPAASLSLRKYPAIFAVLMVLMMTVIDGTVMNVALPVLASELAVSDSLSVWLITIYQLVITMLLLPMAAIGDRYSYRKVFVAGTLIFTISSLACAAGSSFTSVLIARAFQGIGAAAVMGVNIALTRLIYPREVLGRGLALNAMVIAISTAAGPTLAGVILSLSSWHWLFLINIPFGLAAFFIGKAKLPGNPGYKTATAISKKFDWISAVENMIVFGLIFYALGLFSRGGEIGMGLTLLGVGMMAGMIYVKRQLRIPDPILPVDLFRSRLFSLCICTSVASFIAQNVAMIALPFLFHDRYGFSAIATGLLMTPWSLATMVVSPLAARFVERHHPGKTAAAGMGVYAIGMLLLLLLPSTRVEAWQIAWRMAVCGVGFGMFQTPNNIVMVMATPLKRSGSAGGMQGTARLVGQTLGATMVTLIFAVTSFSISINVCLGVALGFALLAGIFSISRKIRQD
ncbi:MAG: MFS transporter [Muribaculaceae bacterium]|nr:MFS transporter [Muribaculaceae bacterium]